MMQIKMNIILVRRYEHNRFPEGVRQPRFIEHIRIASGELSNKDLGCVDAKGRKSLQEI